MAVTIVTLEDLEQFKKELLTEIEALMRRNGNAPQKKWLRSQEVKEMLNVSTGTLQNLRINGSIPYTKVGGVLYYDSEDIAKLLLSNKKQNCF
jgi:hypothetical protein